MSSGLNKKVLLQYNSSASSSGASGDFVMPKASTPLTSQQPFPNEPGESPINSHSSEQGSSSSCKKSDSSPSFHSGADSSKKLTTSPDTEGSASVSSIVGETRKKVKHKNPPTSADGCVMGLPKIQRSDYSISPLTSNSSSSNTPSTASLPDSLELEERATRVCYKKVWGKLQALDENFVDFNLLINKSKYTFGRAQGCDYSFDIPSIRKTKYFQHYSKVHFTLSCAQPDIDRVSANDNDFTPKVWLQNHCATNGLFVSDYEVPNKKKVLLKPNDIIQLCDKNNAVFIFIDSKVITKQPDPERHPREVVKKYRFVYPSLGGGAFGHVYKAYTIPKQCKVAVKVIKKKKSLLGEVVPDTACEGEILMKARHEFIIKVFQVVDSPQNYYIVMECANGGELFDRVSKKERLEESMAKLYFYQMLNAVEYLHDNNITHRDLKAENVLMMTEDEETLCKITDFGVSRFSNVSAMHSIVGTRSYWAPELITKAAHGQGYTRAVDLWSLGVILYFCLGGYLPFSTARKPNLHKQIVDGDVKFHANRWSTVSEVAKNMVSSLLTVDVDKRPTASKALKHVWLAADNSNIIEQLDCIRSKMPNNKYEEIWSDVKATCRKSPPVAAAGEENSPCKKRQNSNTSTEDFRVMRKQFKK